ncbi:hypothetical protein [Pedobacter agri]|uniref:hypothetical protein n=1 Tax=Pedobacter agri TaxID=454586 RepID=UPI00292E4521|nr:hypothetical protein [Pedobacter agri]
MKKYITIIATIILLFGGCTAHRKILKTQSNIKIQNDIESSKEIHEVKSSVELGKSLIKESSTSEEILIKKPVNIELTANFRIDSTAFLRGDTALKLVDISNRNVSITIYQNGKTKVLTAMIKTLQGVQDVPFTEINIKKSITSKSTSVDTSKKENIEVNEKSNLKDKSKISVSSSTLQSATHKVNHLGIICLMFVIGWLFWWFYKR